jgi:hypothetical protein
VKRLDFRQKTEKGKRTFRGRRDIGGLTRCCFQSVDGTQLPWERCPVDEFIIDTEHVSRMCMLV